MTKSIQMACEKAVYSVRTWPTETCLRSRVTTNVLPPTDDPADVGLGVSVLGEPGAVGMWWNHATAGMVCSEGRSVALVLQLDRAKESGTLSANFSGPRWFSIDCSQLAHHGPSKSGLFGIVPVQSISSGLPWLLGSSPSWRTTRRSLFASLIWELIIETRFSSKSNTAHNARGPIKT